MKKKILFLLLLFLVGFQVEAKEPTLCDRDSLPNHGVHKKWKITENNLDNVKRTPCVDASEKIYDFAGVLTEEEYDALKARIDKYIRRTNMDFVIVIESYPYQTDSENEDYAADFYDYNDFGIEFENYSGTLFFRNTYEKDPYYDVYTFGDAQLYYDYDRLQVLLDGVYDNIHEGNYYAGFIRYIDYLEDFYRQGKSLKNYTVDEEGYLQKNYTYPLPEFIVFSTIITFIVMVILVRKNKMIAKAEEAKDYLDPATSKITHKEDKFVSTYTTSYRITSSSSSGGSFGGSFGGGGGSFHSHSGSSGGGHSSGGGRHG